MNTCTNAALKTLWNQHLQKNGGWTPGAGAQQKRKPRPSRRQGRGRSGTKVIAEYASGAAPGSPTKEYIYSGSALLATIESGATKYHISDHLSMRVTTDGNGVKIADSAHYPFGENLYETGGVNKLKFTSYERDAESSNDYAMMRTSINRLGRFSSPDPIAGAISDPQSLNRYAYVLNDPIRLIDPLGLCQVVWFDGGVQIICSPLGWGGGGGGSHRMYAPLIDDPPDIGGRGGGFRDPLARFFPQTQPPPPPGYEDCIKAALREVIAAGEVPNEPNSGYGTLVRGVVYSAPYPFNIFVGQRNLRLDPSWVSGHPGIQVQLNPAYRTSSAYKRYQITGPTAADPRFNFNDFSPRGQDAAANTMMRSLGMVGPAMQGNLGLAMARGNSTWVSLPGGSAPGQHSMSMATARSVFNNALATLPDCL